MFHHWIALVIFALLSLAGIGLTIVGIGGTFLVLFGALLYNLISWSWAIPGTIILWILGLAILGEVLEWIITAAGVKAAGATGYALVGTIIGAVIGGIVLSVVPIIGTIIGVILGAILGAFLLEYMHTKKSKKAWKAAKAAILGRALVSLSKFLIAVVQIWLVLRALF